MGAPAGDIDWPAHFEKEIAGDIVGYARDRWVYNRPIFAAIQRRFPRGARIIECGTGTGLYSSLLSRFGYSIHGVDVSPGMVELARRNAKRLGASDVEFSQASILDLSEHHGRYELAYSCGVIEHFYHEDAVRAVAEHGRCAPTVFVLVPSKWAWRIAAPTTEGIFECYDVARLRRVVRDAGLVIEEEIGFSAGNKVGRAIELLCPPVVAPRLMMHFAATIGVIARSPYYRPA